MATRQPRRIASEMGATPLARCRFELGLVAMIAPAAAMASSSSSRAWTQWASVRRGREQAERLQALNDSLRIGAVGESALIARLQKMHVHAPACLLRPPGDRREQRVGTPLRSVWPELHGEGRALDGRGDRFDARELFLDVRHRLKELRFHRAPGAIGKLRQDVRGRAIDERVAVAHEDGERHADADIGRGPGELARLLDRPHGPVEAGVMRHDRAGAASRRPAESSERAEIRVDRRHGGEPQEPALERLAGGAERGRRQRPCMVVRVDQRRHRQARAGRRHRGRRDRGNAAALERDVDRRTRRLAVGRQHHDAGKPPVHAAGSSMMLTWAATMRQPSAKRIQVCICRPILPGALSRRKSVAATAQSRP